MNLKNIRRSIIKAICSDPELFNILVLKGGNALGLIHEIGHRASVDIDFSMEKEFADDLSTEQIFKNALSHEFLKYDLIVFDEHLSKLPKKGSKIPEWGGYKFEFKLIESEKWKKLNGNLEKLRIQSFRVDSKNSSQKFKIDISTFEFIAEKELAEIDEVTCYVYSPAMIAIEKLRAICQQMDGYPGNAHKTPRARDFFDIYKIIQARALDLTSSANRLLLIEIFKAKDVPLTFLARIPQVREFHSADWLAVKDSIPFDDQSYDFDYYFDFLVKQVEKLQSFWEE